MTACRGWLQPRQCAPWLSDGFGVIIWWRGWGQTAISCLLGSGSAADRMSALTFDGSTRLPLFSTCACGNCLVAVSLLGDMQAHAARGICRFQKCVSSTWGPRMFLLGLKHQGILEKYCSCREADWVLCLLFDIGPCSQSRMRVLALLHGFWARASPCMRPQTICTAVYVDVFACSGRQQWCVLRLGLCAGRCIRPP